MSSTPMELAEPIQSDETPIQPDDPANLGLASIPAQRVENEDDFFTDLDLEEVQDGAGAAEALGEYNNQDEDSDMDYSLTHSLMLHLISEHGLVNATTMNHHEQYRWHHEAHTIGVVGLDDPGHLIHDLSWRPEIAIALIFDSNPVTFPSPLEESDEVAETSEEADEIAMPAAGPQVEPQEPEEQDEADEADEATDTDDETAGQST